jgi:hypothetical protein
MAIDVDLRFKFLAATIADLAAKIGSLDTAIAQQPMAVRS